MNAACNRAIRLDGAKCVAARAQRGLSRERLADESRGGLSIATIKRVEKGVPVYLDTARRLSALLGVPLPDLVMVSDTASASGPPEAASTPATVAVLPFEVLEAGDDSRFFGDGLIEDLITRLGRQWFPVIARSSSFRYREHRPDPRTLRDELGADYVIEGSVRRWGSRLRVNARLTDTKTAIQLWADCYDRAYEDVFAVQDALVAVIVGQVGGSILAQEVRGLLPRDPADLTAWELALRGNWHLHRRTRDANAEARSLFEAAVRRDPTLATAWYPLALTHARDLQMQWADPAGALTGLKGVCAEFRRRHPGESGLQIVSAMDAIYSGDRASAMARLRDAIELDPNAATAYSLYGQTLAMEGDAEAALEPFEVAIRLSPRDAELGSVQLAVSLCHFVAERYGEMLDWAGRAVKTNPDMPFFHGAVAVARASLGDAAGAREAMGEMLRLEPRTSAAGLGALVASTQPAIAARYIAALRLAGLQG